MKKLIIPFLFLICLICMVALPASATSTDTSETRSKKLNWEMDNTTSTLTISGQGAMDAGEYPPWSHLHKRVKYIVLEDGVTSVSRGAFSSFGELQAVQFPSTLQEIESYAFSGCSELTSVTIPDSVVSIGESAFSSCSNLTEVILGSNLQSIGNYAFSDCTKLKEIHIPDCVAEIGNSAFNRCTSLHTVTIGAGASSISSTAFDSCSALPGVTVSTENPYYHSDRGVLYNKAKTELICMTAGFSGAYEILPGVTVIGHSRLNGCTKLTHITIPESVTHIEDNAFMNCTSLTEITFPGGIYKIGDNAFSRCSSLKKIIFTGMAPMIRGSAFYDVTATVYYPPSSPGWTDSKKNYGGSLQWISTSCIDQHTIKIIPGTPATCAKTGLSESQVCSVCGKTLVKAQTIYQTEHTYSPWVEVTAPTEQAHGLKQRTCAVCGNLDELLIPLLNPTEPTPTEPTGPTTPPTEPTEPPVTEPFVTEPPVTEPPTIQPTETTPTEPVSNTSPADTNRFGILAIVLASILVPAGIILAIVVYKRKKTF